MEIMYDDLTGLYNKQWAVGYTALEIKKGGKVSLAVLDIDFFTNINDKIGYEEGDYVLKGFAGCFPNTDTIKSARYGDDEFLLIFIDYQKDFIDNFLNTLKKKIKSTQLIRVEPYKKVPIKFSAGVYLYMYAHKDPLIMLKIAETALAMAKKRGRNRIEYLEKQQFDILKEPGICTTLTGRNIRGDCEDGEEAFMASIKEPYGVEINRDMELLFVDRSNKKKKVIRDGRIYTVAGNGISGCNGDGGSAERASLSKPSGVAVHYPSGRMYIADTGNHCIRMIENDKITTLAGCGKSGYGGDGGDAKLALLNRPGGVVVDREGNVYTNDYGNNVVRMIDIYGIITTIAGNGQYGYEGDNAPAVNASLNKCYGLCVDSEHRILYLADYGNHCIRKVDLQSGIISTFCGTGIAGYSGDGKNCSEALLDGPFWICLNNRCDVFIADADSNCIRMVDAITNIITTVAGNKDAGYVDSESDYSDIRMNIPAGIVIQDEFLYIADYGNNAIRKVII